MVTNKIDAKKLIEHLRAKWKERPCPMCGEGPWSVQDSAFELRQFHGGAMVVGGAIVPVVPVVCSNCGNTVLVNAILAKLVEPQEEGKK